ncbi:MAG: serine/threonine protein kinase [Anaerolineae bacterium]|nr:serine/threonine protein kinase [Anaerolineae bacterium]
MSDEAIVLNGRYQLLERVGSGGMAVVYKAQDRALGRIVAIKMLQESLTSDEGFLRRFQREAHAAANLTHPNIVTVHDIGQDGHRYYIVMEFVDGRTLKQLIRQYADNGRFMPINHALDLTVQICNGIGYAHRANLVHCDVKPQNILVTHDEQVKVADFGIARAMSQATQQLTTDQVWGTPQYFSPEQAAGEMPTPASDVYAIGVLMFEMLTGRLPFQAESHTALALKHIQEPPPPITIYNPSVPKQLEQIINKLLAKEPAGRYRTAGQLGRILGAYKDRSQAETGTVYPAPLVAAHQAQPQTSVSLPPTAVSPANIPVAEQKTQIYHHLSADGDESPTQSTPAQRVIRIPANQTAPGNDWTAIALGVIALIALLGLIPLWLMVYLAWTG